METLKDIKTVLSSREKEILNLIMYEYTTYEIALKLCLSHETIKSHRKHLFQKFNARNVAGLVRRAFEYQVVSPKQLKKMGAVSGSR
jgi:DNA-binding CsgD family transcriptional regulator